MCTTHLPSLLAAPIALMRRVTRAGWREAFVTAMAVSIGISVVVADEFTPQPANQHSNITCWTPPTTQPTTKAARSVWDADFAKALHTALGDNGFHSMIITLGQCFSGGIIDDVAAAFQNSTRPISMTSAAPHNLPSWSLSIERSGLEAGYNFWSEAYKDVHPGIQPGGINANPKEGDESDRLSAYIAAKRDAAWKRGSPPSEARQSQYKALNGGKNIKLGGGVNGSGAGSYHAILFVGDAAAHGQHAARPDFWNDLARQRSMLIKAGYPPGNIKTYYFDGNVEQQAWEADPDKTTTRPLFTPDGAATRQNLLAAIAALQPVMNSNEQLYIYIGDHGSTDQKVDQNGKVIQARGQKNEDNTFLFDPPADSFNAALQDSTNTSGPYIEIAIAEGYVVAPGWELFFNDQPVHNGDNTIPAGPNGGAYRFSVNTADVRPNAGNDVWLRNVDSQAPDILVDVAFSAGDIAPHVVVDTAPPGLDYECTAGQSYFHYVTQGAFDNHLEDILLENRAAGAPYGVSINQATIGVAQIGPGPDDVDVLCAWYDTADFDGSPVGEPVNKDFAGGVVVSASLEPNPADPLASYWPISIDLGSLPGGGIPLTNQYFVYEQGHYVSGTDLTVHHPTITQLWSSTGFIGGSGDFFFSDAEPDSNGDGTFGVSEAYYFGGPPYQANFYLDFTACIPCDTNCDGSVNPFDINSFLSVLTGNAGCSVCAGDADVNGSTNPFDINAFLVCLGA